MKANFCCCWGFFYYYLNTVQIWSEVCRFLPVQNKLCYSASQEKMEEDLLTQIYIFGNRIDTAKLLLLFLCSQEGHTRLALKCQQDLKTAACPCFLIKNQLSQHRTSCPSSKGNTYFSELFVQILQLINKLQVCLKDISENFSGY